MGCKNEGERLDLIIDYASIINEEKIKDRQNLTVKQNKILLEKAETSICEISKDNGYGSGFFCKTNYEKEDICC